MAALILAGGGVLAHQISKYNKNRKEKKLQYASTFEDMQAENKKIDAYRHSARRESTRRSSIQDDLKNVSQGLYDTSRPGSPRIDAAPPSYDDLGRNGFGTRNDGDILGEKWSRDSSSKGNRAVRSMVDEAALTARKSREIRPDERIATKDFV